MDTEWLLPVTAAVNAAILVLVLAVFGVSLAVRLRLSAIERTRTRIAAQWRPVLVRWVAGDHVPPPALTGFRDTVAWLRLWNAFHELVTGPTAPLALNALAERLGLPARLPRLLRRGREARLQAIVAMGNLHHPLVATLLPDLVQRGGAADSIAAADALAKARPDEAVERIVPLILDRPEWTLPRVATVLTRLEDAQVCARLVQMIATAPRHRLQGLLRLIHTLNCTDASEAVWDLLLTEDDPDIVAPALNLLHDAKSVAVLYGLMLHESWVIRMSALAAIGRTASRAHLDYVLPMLRDPAWWVRYRAAQAVAALCHDDVGAMRRIRADETDPFAREMLDQVMAEVLAA